MRTYPNDDYGNEELARINAEQWMIDLLKLNPEYPHWGPHEDYMWVKGDGWNSPLLKRGWSEGRVSLNELNEVVNFYFEVERASEHCAACDGCGLNPETKRINDAFYDHEGLGGRWCNDLTQDEVDALVEQGRLRQLVHEGKSLTPGDVNAWNQQSFGHDAINRWILVETRAKRFGVYGQCPRCDGHGHVFTEPAAHVNLVAWLLHPRKGASRGLEISYIQQDDLPEIFLWLREAADRNADRFSKIPR